MSTNKNFSPRLAAVNDNLITLSLMPLHEEGIAILTRSHFKGERQWSFNPDELILIPGSGVTSTFVNRMSRSDLNVPAEVAEFLLKYPGKVPPQWCGHNILFTGTIFVESPWRTSIACFSREPSGQTTCHRQPLNGGLKPNSFFILFK